MDAETINEVLGVLEVSNTEFDATMMRMDLGWLRDAVVDKEFHNHVYWATTDGITNLYFFTDARRWLTLVARKIPLSGNIIVVTSPQALVVAYILMVIRLNVGV